jgi:dolichyl-phosphate beta-glucosyltransferase
MFTRASADAIFSRQTLEHWGYDIELLAIARQLGYSIREAPITWVNAPGSKVRFLAYFEVFSEVWRVRRNIQSGVYLKK